jgi:hypothetical protein
MSTAKYLRAAIPRPCACPKSFSSMCMRWKFSEEGMKLSSEKTEEFNRVFELLTDMSDDFMESGRNQPSVEERERL